MFETIGAPELLIVLAVVMLLFGAGRVGRLGKDLGTSVKEFRRAIREDDEPAPAVTQQYAQLPEATPPAPAPESRPQSDGPQLF
jgi:sec-independent protein translocase protein TatA